MARQTATILKDYGFVETGEGLVKMSNAGNPKTMYTKTEGGFFRFEREDGVWRQYPFAILPAWEGTGGLAFDAKQAALDGNGQVHPECFEWVYSPDWIAAEYGAGQPKPSK